VRNLPFSSFSRIPISLIGHYTLPPRNLTLWLLDIEHFYGQRKLLAQRVPIVQSSPLPNGHATVLSSLGQAQILSRSRAFSDPLTMPSGTGASTPFDSETEFDTELESQHTCGSEGLEPTRLSDHDLRNRYFRRDTIVLSHFDVFRCVSFARAHDKDSRVIIPSSQ
jgi:phosphatidylethanolamine N-methyltransferase